MANSHPRISLISRAAALVAVSSLGLAACGASSGAGGDGEPIKVGALLPLTSASGASAAETARIGIEMAEKQINADGGIDGRQIDLVIADTEGDPTTATSEYTRLVTREDVDVMVGPLFSQETLAMLPMATRDTVFQIHPTAADEITAELGPYAFGVLVGARSQVTAMADFALEQYAPERVAIVHDPGALALSSTELLTSRLEEAGVEIVAEVEHEYGEADMTPTLLQATRSKPDMIFAFDGLGGDVGNQLKARDELGLRNIPVVGSYTWAGYVDEALQFVDESSFENVTGLNYQAFVACEGEQPEGRAVEFADQVREEYPKKAEGLAIHYSSLMYDAMYLVKAAIEGSDGSTDGETLADWVVANTGGFSNVNTGLTATEDNHFVVGPEDLAVAYPVDREDGVIQRSAGC